VRDRELDLAIVAWPGAPPRGVRLITLVREPMVLVCPPGHRLAGRASIDLADLAAEPLVDYPPGWGVRMAVDRAFAAAGVERRTGLEVGDTQTVVDLVAHGLGPAILPEWVGRRGRGIRLVPFRRRAPLWEESVVTPEDGPAGPAAAAFCDALLAAARRPSL
jgi:DNA-binding transcriptional LysR family regulator